MTPYESDAQHTKKGNGLVCGWVRSKEHEHNIWETACGGIFEIINGLPQDNEMLYCPFCGGGLDQDD